ncbi:H-type lectin domain protein (macronuclear) [Tetrahymena thermophila SB210]|uniref:H-type lectin domain protein n=1 Tax=Tetrahymena thermophila (strain SB210) TaxID=312017 RepID=W7XI83_TETTS|nr:H-type lectin domain protein [Tetrahymena thermophila SB210]EWS74396.1 H-type lectin domain protein [Tetrahymena thermophila SB210]|eukprot:XP_012653073.1 H-type lectin domain protein [Tetrahymena thermophila SB210]
MLKCQITYSDQVPIVYFQQNIWLFKYGDGTYQGSQTIDYSANSFQQIPIVILGIEFYNNFWNPSTGVDFVLSAADITKTSCTVKTARNNNSFLVGISISALVIDTSQFPFFIKSDQQINNIQFKNYVYQKVYTFSSNIQNQSNKCVSVILTGWKSTYDSSNKVFALTVQVVSITDSGYTIQISTAQDSQQIINVSFTVLEYIKNPPTSVYGIVSNYDNQYQQPTTQNCFFNDQCSNSQRFFPVQFNVFIQNSPPSGNYQNFFVSLNQLYFNTAYDGQDLRITIINQPLSSNKIQYQYSVWDSSQCLGATSTALYFYKKTCPNNQFLNINSNSCSSICLIQDPSNSSNCLDCPYGQYFSQDQNLCQTTQPNGYYCSIPNTQYNFNVCQNCKISNCKLCSQNFNQFTCTQCVSQYFLYNNQCQQTQPSNTFCDTQSICSKCLDPGCLTCSDPNQSSPQCLTCDTKQNQILYQGKCYSQSSPPNNTFCDWNKLVCLQCSDNNCLSCSDPAKSPQICNKCVPNQSLILFQGKCYNQNNPPPNTYCDWTKLVCSLCTDSNCLICSDPSMSPQQCLKCDVNQKQVLYQGKCYNQNNQPSNTFCDWNLLQCSKCNDSRCLFCSDPNLPPQICLQCDTSLQKLILYEGKCLSQNDPPPQNSFCDWDKLQCSKCDDNKCLSCSDPNKPPQTCLSCDSSQQQILYQGQCFNKNNPPPNTFCDWNKLQCTQCTDSSCLACSDPTQPTQKCLSCDASKKMVLFQDKCYSQSSPPPNTFCDWGKLQCNLCMNKYCYTCSDPSQSPQVCLSLIVINIQIIEFIPIINVIIPVQNVLYPIKIMDVQHVAQQLANLNK